MWNNGSGFLMGLGQGLSCGDTHFSRHCSNTLACSSSVWYIGLSLFPGVPVVGIFLWRRDFLRLLLLLFGVFGVGGFMGVRLRLGWDTLRRFKERGVFFVGFLIIVWEELGSNLE